MNTDTTASLAGLSFTDDLGAVLPGLLVDSLPLGEPCGVGSTVSGTSTISLADGFLGPGGSCTFLVTLRLPASVADGTYVNTTSQVSSAGRVAGPPAVASLTVRSRAVAVAVPGTTGLGLLLLGLGISVAGAGLIAGRALRQG